MTSDLLIRLGIIALLFAAAVLFFLRPLFRGGKGGAKGNRFHSAGHCGGNPAEDGHGSHGHGGGGHGAGGGGD